MTDGLPPAPRAFADRRPDPTSGIQVRSTPT